MFGSDVIVCLFHSFTKMNKLWCFVYGISDVLCSFVVLDRFYQGIFWCTRSVHCWIFKSWTSDEKFVCKKALLVAKVGTDRLMCKECWSFRKRRTFNLILTIQCLDSTRQWQPFWKDTRYVAEWGKIMCSVALRHHCYLFVDLFTFCSLPAWTCRASSSTDTVHACHTNFNTGFNIYMFKGY